MLEKMDLDLKTFTMSNKCLHHLDQSLIFGKHEMENFVTKVT